MLNRLLQESPDKLKENPIIEKLLAMQKNRTSHRRRKIKSQAHDTDGDIQMHKANTKDDTSAAASATATSAFSSARSDQDDEVMEANDGEIDDDAEGDGLDVMDEEEY